MEFAACVKNGLWIAGAQLGNAQNVMEQVLLSNTEVANILLSANNAMAQSRQSAAGIASIGRRQKSDR